MKRKLLILMLLLLSGCESHPAISVLPNPVPDQILPVSEKGISLTLNQSEFTGSPATIETIIRNDSAYNYSIGEFYHIEVKIDDLWYILTYSDKVFYENPRFKDFGSTLLTGHDIQQNFSIEALGVTLIPGEYRLVKSVLSQGESFYEISIAAPFWIN